MKLHTGSIVLVDLDPTLGQEQRGIRSCIVVSDPDVVMDQRFPVLCIVPVTSTAGDGLLYPALKPGTSGLTKASWALVDHVRSIDKRRIRCGFGAIPFTEMRAVDEALTVFLGISGENGAPRSDSLH